MPEAVDVLIVGAGATGAYFGTRLLQADRDVTMLVRDARRRDLEDRGMRLIEADGTLTVTHPTLATAAELRRTYDVILLAVKATALDAAIDDLRPAVGEQTVIIPFLNGMLHIDRLQSEFGEDRVLGGVVRVVTSTDDDGTVRQLAPGASLLIGELVHDRSGRLATIAEALDVPGYDFGTSDDILHELWSKWMFIASIGALTTLFDGSAGRIAAIDGGPAFAAALVAEACGVAAADGHPISSREQQQLAAMFTDPDSELTSSLYRDMAAGRTTEVEQVIGDLARRGQDAGVSVARIEAAAMRLRGYEALRIG